MKKRLLFNYYDYETSWQDLQEVVTLWISGECFSA